jgi:hypothetical protein
MRASCQRARCGCAPPPRRIRRAEASSKVAACRQSFLMPLPEHTLLRSTHLAIWTRLISSASEYLPCSERYMAHMARSARRPRRRPRRLGARRERVSARLPASAAVSVFGWSTPSTGQACLDSKGPRTAGLRPGGCQSPPGVSPDRPHPGCPAPKRGASGRSAAGGRLVTVTPLAGAKQPCTGVTARPAQSCSTSAVQLDETRSCHVPVAAAWAMPH